MVLSSNEFKKVCSTVLFAIDNKDVSLLTETLELNANGDVLHLNVTNGAYYTTVSFALSEPAILKASVNAKKFLSLISKITTETIELKVEGNTLKVIANGKYTLPIIYKNDEMLELPKIEIENVTNEMTVQGNILLSIANNNSKELLRGICDKPQKRYYYVDNEGAITYTSGACVNSFTLEKPIKMLLSDKVVKLFKLFKEDSNVKVTMGQDQVADDIIQTKVRFEADNIVITNKLTNSSLITSVPASIIRALASKEFPYSVVLDRNLLTQAINRIMLFNDEDMYGGIKLDGQKITIHDLTGGSSEDLDVVGTQTNPNAYSMTLNLHNFKLMIDGCEDEYVTLCFGDHKTIVVRKNSITDLMPEMVN